MGRTIPRPEIHVSIRARLRRLARYHYKIENKKDGKVVTTGSLVLAPDGKSRTLTTTGTNAEGKKMSATFVYDKE